MELNLIPQPLKITMLSGTSAVSAVTETIVPDLREEAYRLHIVAEGISLEAGSETGLIWGRKTLEQLGRQFPGELPCMEIADEPAYAYRAFHMDSARHMLPMEEMKKIIDAAAYFKLNRFHWHFSDDQGWRIECKAFPKLHEIGAYRKGDHFGRYNSDEIEGGYYTRQEVKELVDYCHERGIQVVPEIDLPGHVTAILAAYPHLSCHGMQLEVSTQTDISRHLLCAGREDVFAFVEALLEDMLELFPDPWFHIGGDEAPKYYWERCPHCQARIQAENLDNTRQLQGWFSNRIAAFLRQRGKQVLMWNDGAWGGNVDSEMIMQIWFPDQDSAMDKHVAKGGKVMLSPVDVCYCDYPHGAHPLEGVYHMDLQPHGFPRDSVIGGECLTWAEHIRTAYELQTLAFPRFTALAEVLWLGENRPGYGNFRERLDALLPVFAEKGIRLLAPECWDPDPAEREAQTQAFLAQAQAQFAVDYEQLLSEM